MSIMKCHANKYILWAISCSFLLSHTLLLASVDPLQDAQFLSNDAEPKNEKMSEDPLDLIKMLKIKGILLVSSNESVQKKRVEMRGVKIQDLDVPDVEGLASDLAGKFLDKPLNREAIQGIKNEIIANFRAHDRPIVLVDIPEQDVTEGVVQFIVIEGRLGEIICKGNKWFSDKSLKRYIRLKPGDAINSEKLLNDIAWLNRSRFRRSDVIFMPGKKEGTTDLELVTQDKIPLRIFAGDDNTGNKATGRGRWFVGFNWGNLFNLDHTLTYQFTSAYNLHRFYSHTVNYVSPFPWHHTLMIYGSYSKVHPLIRVFYNNAKSAQANLRYQIPLKSLFKSYLSELTCGFDYKWTNNNLEFTGGKAPEIVTKDKINLTQLTAGYNYGKNFARDHLSFSSLVFYSPGIWLRHQSREEYKKLNPSADSHYVYGRIILANQYFIPKICSLWGQVRLQLSSAPLLPSEQFGLGGYDTVRGYEERVSNTDNALCVNFEVRSRPFSPFRLMGKDKLQDQLVFHAFIDYGKGINDAKGFANDKNHWLLGVGPGIRYNLGSNISARVDLGFKLHVTEFSDEPWAKVHFGILASY